MTASVDDLAGAIRARRAILFVGAGVSMSVGLPSWRELIAHLTRQLGLDPARIENSTASFQLLAEFYKLQEGSIGPLRSWMDRNWKLEEAQVSASPVHKLIVDLDFPIIYTTNYDRNLEMAYRIHRRPFLKIANAKDLAKIGEGTTQIVKFHGDFDDDESLVIAESDYFNRLPFTSPLDVKFRADALARTILFIGYSMSDTNIRVLMHRLWETWNQSGFEKDRPPSFVFMARPDPVQEAVLGRWGLTLLSSAIDDPQQALEAFLGDLAARVAEPGTHPRVRPRRRARRAPNGTRPNPDRDSAAASTVGRRPRERPSALGRAPTEADRTA